MLLFFTQTIPKCLCMKNGKQGIKKTHIHPMFYVHAQKMVQIRGIRVWKYHSTRYFFCNTWLSTFLPFHCSGFYYFFNKSNICMWTWKCLITIMCTAVLLSSCILYSSHIIWPWSQKHNSQLSTCINEQKKELTEGVCVCWQLLCQLLLLFYVCNIVSNRMDEERKDTI